MTQPSVTKFMFYSGSKDALPGAGASEALASGEQFTDYPDLYMTPGWRAMLSNFWNAPFDIEGERYDTVKHYQHSRKFASNFPEFAATFTSNSGSRWAHDPGMAKGAGGKSGCYRKVLLRPHTVFMDTHFDSNTVQRRGVMAKFHQHENLRKVLLGTRDAELWHGIREPLTRQHILEGVRADLRALG